MFPREIPSETPQRQWNFPLLPPTTPPSVRTFVMEQVEQELVRTGGGYRGVKVWIAGTGDLVIASENTDMLALVLSWLVGALSEVFRKQFAFSLPISGEYPQKPNISEQGLREVLRKSRGSIAGLLGMIGVWQETPQQLEETRERMWEEYRDRLLGFVRTNLQAWSEILRNSKASFAQHQEEAEQADRLRPCSRLELSNKNAYAAILLNGVRVHIYFRHMQRTTKSYTQDIHLKTGHVYDSAEFGIPGAVIDCQDPGKQVITPQEGSTMETADSNVKGGAKVVYIRDEKVRGEEVQDE